MTELKSVSMDSTPSPKLDKRDLGIPEGTVTMSQSYVSQKLMASWSFHTVTVINLAVLQQPYQVHIRDYLGDHHKAYLGDSRSLHDSSYGFLENRIESGPDMKNFCN